MGHFRPIDGVCAMSAFIRYLPNCCITATAVLDQQRRRKVVDTTARAFSGLTELAVFSLCWICDLTFVSN